MFENLDQIKQAIEVERKFEFINIQGKTKKFSQFMMGEIMNIYKSSKRNPKWKIIYEAFKLYSTDNVSNRRKTIDRFIRMVNAELHPAPKHIKTPEETDIIYLKGIGPKLGNVFNKLGIYTVLDLLFYFPRRHIDYSNKTLIKNLKEGENVTIFGYIKSVNAFVSKNKLSILKIKINDESGTLDLNFFYANSNRVMFERYKSQFPKGAEIMVSGTVKINNYDGKPTLDKPQYSIISTGDKTENLNLGRIVPVYPLSEKINVKTLRKAVNTALQEYKDQIETVIPKDILEKYDMLEKKEAISQIHFPESAEQLEKARFSLVFEEFFLIQLRLAILREEKRKEKDYIPLHIAENGLVNKFITNLPFELTNAQQKAIKDILHDLNSETGMHRLLQGDVGSGKTVVATVMLLAAVENGYQGAIMAPTEILAQQHYNNMINWLTPLGLSVGLFLGSNTKKQREKSQTDLLNGQTHIAVGTHALIQNDIKFNNLGAVVVDEQHRFGVKQRNILKNKSMFPQMLTMTATPIPRTLALTVHGDLDLTVIDELPKGRKPIKTFYVTKTGKEVINLIKTEIDKGHQAYIVFPLIDESETLSAKAATVEAERLQATVFSQYKIGLLHGKLKNAEKEQVMQDFKNKKYDILVSTTVVEVGVDVPNATVMVIENAERFGLSQLHQLRGRVGRSNQQSYCILSSSSRSEETKIRLKIMEQTNDGFVIAEQDLALRGPGEFLGTRQSGLPDLVISDIVRDARILELARKEALKLVQEKNLDTIMSIKNSPVFKSSISPDLLNSG